MDPTPEHLVRDHGPRLRALAARLVGAGDDADEVVQRTWVAAWHANPRHPGAWLERVVRRVAGRLRQDEANVRERERRAARPEAQPDASAPLEQREALEALAAGLADLPPEQAEVVLLRYADGLTQGQVAERLGIPVNTVRSRSRRGLARLREHLERRGTDWRPALTALAAPASPPQPATGASLGALLMSSKTAAACAALFAALIVLTFALDGRTSHEVVAPDPGVAESKLDENQLHGKPAPSVRAAAVPRGATGEKPGRTQDPRSLEECLLLTSPSQSVECIDAWLSRRAFPLAEQQVGSLICLLSSTQDRPYEPRRLVPVIQRILGQRASGGDLIDSIEAMRRACPRVATSGCIRAAVMNLRTSDPGLFDHIVQLLVPERVFDSTGGDTAIRLAVQLARELDDPHLQNIVLDGGRGLLGGTDEQTDVAALCALEFLEPGADSLAYVEGLLAAPYLPDGAERRHLGSTLAVLLTCPQVAGHCPEQQVLDGLRAALEDPVLGAGAALQITRQMSQHRPPDGLSEEGWANIWRLASRK